MGGHMQMHIRLRTAIAAHILLAATSLAMGQTVQTPSVGASQTYSATAIHGLPGQSETSGKIVKSGQNMRLEFDQNGETVIQILRPTEGLMYILDPADQTYIEIRGQAVPATKTGGYTTPCPDTARLAQCERTGTDTVSGIAVERWALTSTPQTRPLIILWDSTRSRALRQEFPDGGVMAMKFQAMENLNGRMTEHWTIKITTGNQPANQPANTGSWWFDPELRVVVREDLPGGEVRRLEDITVGPVDAAAFQVPEGWQKQDAPNTSPTPATLQPPQPAAAGE